MRSNPVVGTELHYDDEVLIQCCSTEVRGRVVRKVVPLPRRLTVDAETDALITQGAHLLDMSREALVAEAIHRMAATQGIEVDQAFPAAGESVVLPIASRAQEGSI